MIEFAQQCPECRLFGMRGLDAGMRQPVEDAELLFTQPLVHTDLLIGRTAARSAEDLSRLDGADIGRSEHYLRAAMLFARGEPFAECPRLLFAQLGQRHIDVAAVERDPERARGIRGIARNIAGALSVADDP